MNFHLSIVVLSFLFSFCESANVLIIFSVPSKSHTILGHALGRGLVKNGHNVTMLSPYPQDKNIPNYHDLKLTKVMDAWNAFMNKNESRINMNKNYALMFQLFENAGNLAEGTIEDDNFQKLMNVDHKFDVVIISALYNEALFATAHYFNAPLISFATTGPSIIVNYLVGNPNPYAYVPELFLSFSDRMTFLERLINTSFGVLLNTLKYFLHHPVQEKVLKKHFPNAPNIEELQKLVALVFANSHRSLDYSRPLVPNIIEVGGLQVGKPNKLADDLLEFMNNATEGVIYFSLGTNIRSEDMPNETRDSFVKVFSKLKQKVLWKWDEPSIPGLSKNVRLSKWYPQGDLLAHPNLQLFITHGGLLSTTETLVRGVACIGIPIFGDQQRNMQTAEAKGFAVTLEFSNISTKSLTWALDEALSNPKYRKQAKKLSLLLNDNIVHPLDKAVYWVEYVIRHKGAPHLRSAGADIPMYQYLLLDIISFILFILFVIFSISYLVCKQLIKIVKNNFIEKKDKND